MFTVEPAGFYADDETSPISNYGKPIHIEIVNHGYKDDNLNTNKTTIKIGEYLFQLETLKLIIEEAATYHKAIVATKKE
jgi:hypothetical protein